MPTKNIDKKLYNESQKLEYIEFEKNSKEVTLRYLKRISEGEEKYNKDIADMNFSEIVDTLSLLNIMRESSRGQMLSLVKGYVNWAQLFGKTKNNSPINAISSEMLNSNSVIASRMIRSPEQLQEILDVAYIHNQPNRMIHIQLIFWLLYYGVEISNFPTLKKTDIDYANEILTVNTKQYSLDERVVNLWRSCCNILNIERNNGKSSKMGQDESKSSDIILLELIENDYLFRPVKGTKEGTDHTLSLNYFILTLKNLCSTYTEKSGNHIKLSPINITNSGKFYKILMLEKAGNTIDEKLLSDFFNIDNSNSSTLTTLTRKWKIDYEDWKLAFGYMN